MLRKGRTKQILDSSIDSALLAVEIYNKPRTPFRIENYISLMIISWTRLFHAYFNHTIGDIFYYKKKNSTRYERVDGERKSWELKTCINKYNSLDKSVKANLEFFIKLRNKIEHRHISKEDIGLEIFGECQSLLYNYENILIKFFGEDCAINESLAFSLQFSRMRTIEQNLANKKILSKDIMEINKFIKKYRSGLKTHIFNSQEYSIKLIQIPRISNDSKKSIPAIEFVNWSNLSNEDKKKFEKMTTLIKDKIIKTEVINPGKLKAGNIVEKISQDTSVKDFNHHDHKCLYFLFSIRPTANENVDAFKTNIKYCHYDEVHTDYVYQEDWANLIIKIIKEGKLSKSSWKNKFKKQEKLNIGDFK